MRAPTRAELVLAVLFVVGAALAKSGWSSNAAKKAELVLMTAERDEVQRANGVLLERLGQVDADAKADSITRAEVVEEAESTAAEAATTGRAVFEEAVEAVPDSMPELRALIVKREQIHTTEIEQKDILISEGISAAATLRGQLIARDSLLVGYRGDIAAANGQIALLESMRGKGLSTLESVAIGAGAYVVTTEVLGGSVTEGLVAGTVTFVVTQGGSWLLRRIF